MFQNNEDDSIVDYVNDQLKILLEDELRELERKKSENSDKQETKLDDDEVDCLFCYREEDEVTDSD